MLQVIRRTILFIIFIFFVSVLDSQAQILAPAGTLTIPTSYLPSDPIFLFDNLQNVALRYESESAESNYTFEWSSYNVDTKQWDYPFLIQNGNSATLIVNEQGGYRLKIIKDSDQDDELLHCWVFEPKITNTSIDIEFQDCFSLHLLAEIDTVPLIYYHPETGSPDYVDYKISFNWTADTEIELAQGQLSKMEAPIENTIFKVDVLSEILKHNYFAELNYTAMAVKAGYKAEIIKDEVDNEEHSAGETVVSAGSAPIEIRFNDESKGNVTSWEWRFGRGNLSSDQNPFHVFTSLGTDTVNLKVYNRDSGCYHQMENPMLVTIMESMVEAPNTFTPNGDGINDEFKVVFRSLQQFSMVIYNRWGKKVFQSSDPAKGWDGKVEGSIGAPGVYFYFIEARGYLPEEKHKLSGPLHLIRGTN